MEKHVKTVLISLPEDDLKLIIIDCMNACLKQNKQNEPPPKSFPSTFRYKPIQEIFKEKICSKPTFYLHLKAGDFTLYKFGNKSFVDSEEFLSAFHKVKFNNKIGGNSK